MVAAACCSRYSIARTAAGELLGFGWLCPPRHGGGGGGGGLHRRDDLDDEVARTRNR